MSLSSLDQILKSFGGQPAGPVPDAHDWAAIETAIGRPVPQDFKSVIEHTGGCNMGWCVLRNPAVKDNVYVALTHAALVRESILWGELAMEELNISLYPEPGGWIQLARKDRVSFMLKPEGDDIAIVSYSDWEVIETGLIFSDLMWHMFTDPQAFDGLGRSIWREGSPLFETA